MRYSFTLYFVAATIMLLAVDGLGAPVESEMLLSGCQCGSHCKRDAEGRWVVRASSTNPIVVELSRFWFRPRYRMLPKLQALDRHELTAVNDLSVCPHTPV
jgi:hypothetical protein